MICSLFFESGRILENTPNFQEYISPKLNSRKGSAEHFGGGDSGTLISGNRPRFTGLLWVRNLLGWAVETADECQHTCRIGNPGSKEIRLDSSRSANGWKRYRFADGRPHRHFSFGFVERR